MATRTGPTGPQPLIVGLGGTTRPGSSTEQALRFALAAAAALGAATELIAGPALVLPMFAPESPQRTPEAQHLVSLLRRADGVILASPGYHGSISGLLKNALDYTEDMRGDARSYFDGRAIGCIVSAAGWQAVGSTLAAMRSIAHALRGWPTPLGVGINSTVKCFAPDADGAWGCLDDAVAGQLRMMAGQVVAFAEMRHAHAAASGGARLAATA
jgi:FMN reductase